MTRDEHIAKAQRLLAEHAASPSIIGQAQAHAMIAQAMRPLIIVVARDADPDLIRQQVEAIYGGSL